jgi:uncharacterized OsmC-like protein
MTATVVYHGELRTGAVHQRSGVEIITDAPPDNQGKGEAFSPTDLCATSLACCMMTIMGISARNRNIAIEGTRAEVNKIMASDPRRISRIEIRMIMPPHPFTPEEKKVLEIAARTCPVALSLHPDIEQALEFVWKI